MTADRTATPAAVLVEHPLEQAAKAPAPESATKPGIDDGVLQELAKRRLATKRSLIGQVFDFLLIVFSCFMLANLYYGDAMGFAFCLCLFWALRLAYRWYKFMRPSFKEGIANYLRERKERQLEFEYDRLKKMSTEYVTHELNH